MYVYTYVCTQTTDSSCVHMTDFAVLVKTISITWQSNLFSLSVYTCRHMQTYWNYKHTNEIGTHVNAVVKHIDYLDNISFL